MGLTDLNTRKPFGMRTYDFEGEKTHGQPHGFYGRFLGMKFGFRRKKAETLWDQLFDAGKEYLIKPFGSYALDIARIETGFIQAGVDFVPD